MMDHALSLPGVDGCEKSGRKRERERREKDE